MTDFDGRVIKKHLENKELNEFSKIENYDGVLIDSFL
jgi:hypothetical protein